MGGKLVLRLRRTRRRGVNRLISQKVRFLNLKQLVTAERRTQMMFEVPLQNRDRKDKKRD
jgi:hypothetical protein